MSLPLKVCLQVERHALCNLQQSYTVYQLLKAADVFGGVMLEGVPYRLQTVLSTLSIYRLRSRQYAEPPAPPTIRTRQCLHDMLLALPV